MTDWRVKAEKHAREQFGEDFDPGHVDRLAVMLEKQAKLIAEIRSHLTEAENAEASDGLIWRRAVKFGPDTPKAHAESLSAALRAADEYADSLAGELGLPARGGSNG